jgi:hypothetical protein
MGALPDSVTDEYISGPVLGMVLREVVQTMHGVDDARNWVNQGLTRTEQVERGDWKTAGYSSMSAWLLGAKPGGYSKTRNLALLAFWKSTAPRIKAAGYAVEDILSMLERSAIEEMASLLSGPGADARLASVICKLIVEQRLQTVEDFRALKKSPAFISATKVMDMMKAGDVDPVETYTEFAVLDDSVSERLTQVATFLGNGDLPSSEVKGLIENAREMPLDRLAILRVPHGKAVGAVDSDAATLEAEILADLDSGDTDSHTRTQIEVEDAGDGYYRIVKTTILPRSLLRALWSTRGIDVTIDGEPMAF